MKMLPYIISLLILTAGSQGFGFGSDEAVSGNAIDRLRTDLLKGYSPNARPVRDHNHNTTVRLGISINNIDVDDKTQTFKVVTYLVLVWKDEFLSWTPSEYGNLTVLHFDKEELWMPDVALFNSAGGAQAVPQSTLPLLAFYDSSVYWVPPFTAEVPCQLNLNYWPSDKHVCSLKFGSWTHHGEQINLLIEHFQSNVGVSFVDYQQNSRWEILNYTSSREALAYEADQYHYADFKFTIKRKAASHVTFVTQTTLALMMTVLASYFLPLHFHLSRLLLHLFSLTALIVCNFVLFLALPASGGEVPFVVRYFSGSIVLTTLSLICNVIMATILTNHTQSRQSAVMKKMMKFLGLADTPASTRSQPAAHDEVAYSNLEEELRAVSDDTSEANSREDGRQNRSPSTFATSPHHLTTVSLDSRRGIYRIVNAVIFFMFAIAYIVDYVVLRSSINS